MNLHLKLLYLFFVLLYFLFIHSTFFYYIFFFLAKIPTPIMLGVWAWQRHPHRIYRYWPCRKSGKCFLDSNLLLRIETEKRNSRRRKRKMKIERGKLFRERPKWFRQFSSRVVWKIWRLLRWLFERFSGNSTSKIGSAWRLTFWIRSECNEEWTRKA